MLETSIAAALHGRMGLIAQAMAERVDEPGAWSGYNATKEPLIGRYTKPSSLGGAPTVEYKRPSNPDAEITMGFLEMTDIQEVHRSEACLLYTSPSPRDS